MRGRRLEVRGGCINEVRKEEGRKHVRKEMRRANVIDGYVRLREEWGARREREMYELEVQDMQDRVNSHFNGFHLLITTPLQFTTATDCHDNHIV